MSTDLDDPNGFEDSLRMTAPTPEQMRVLRAAIEGLSIHAEMCGHRRIDPECPYCDDRTTVAAARKALAAIA